MVKLCRDCSELKLERTDFTSPPFEPQDDSRVIVRHGTVGGLREAKAACDLCQLVWLALGRNDRAVLEHADADETWSLAWAQSTNDYQPTKQYGSNRFGSALFPTIIATSGSQRGDYGIQLIDEPTTSEFLRGRLVGDEMRVEMLKGWISRCHHDHGKSCVQSVINLKSLSTTGVPVLTVIDVEELRLCNPPKDTPYVALSYVWGHDNTPVTLLKNQEAFSQMGGLAIKLPQTIQDALELVKALDFRFLWVDSLCIVQDDLDKKQSWIDNMDAIYASAVLTLVAATGTAASSGLSGISTKQDRDQQIVTLNSSVRLGILPDYQRELLHCDHAQRAWT